MKHVLHKDHVAETIKAAFRGVRLEDGVSANMAEHHEAPWKTKYLDLAKSDERDDWTRVSDAVLETRESILHYCDPKGFRFYAPAFMLYALRHHEDWNGRFIVDGILFALSPENPVFRDVSFEKCFTSEQAEAITTFLE